MTMVLLTAGLFGARSARASIAYGSINNFDTVNDTGTECHGFEIELEDINCTDVTYTYDWNHYGTSKISEDTSVPGHPVTTVRWAAKKNPDGSWSAYTAIPSGPIAATDGHRFTNPSVNFGGEHFGVGYRKPPTAVRYNWLVDDGRGNLVKGPAVQVSTPVFNYYPPAQNAPAQVVAEIQPPPPPPEVPVKEFGDPVWMKEIRTTSHNNNKVELRDLVSDDPEDPNDPDWRNGEPDEVEVEWQLLQTEFNKIDGGVNGNVAAAPQELPDGDEVVTRRYEFYKYTGPLDGETGEALADKVGPDDLHGVSKTKEDGTVVDYTGVEIVGEFIGAQMAAVDVEAGVGLIDHVQDAEVGVDYPARTVVVSGALPFTASLAGNLPGGMSFNTATGVLEGTPAESGEFEFSVTAQDDATAPLTQDYILRVAAFGAELPAEYLLETSSEPADGGTTTGAGFHAVGGVATLTATPAPGYEFVNWTENGVPVDGNATFSLPMEVNHSLVANFAPVGVSFRIDAGTEPVGSGSVFGTGNHTEGSSVTLTASAADGFSFLNWTEDATVVGTEPGLVFTATANRSLVAHFTANAVAGAWTLVTASLPSAGGVTLGGGTYANGTSVTVSATPAGGFLFKRWMDGNTTVSTSATHTLVLTSNLTLSAKFAPAYSITAACEPPAGGTASGGGLFEDGDSVDLTATPSAGYTFGGWFENGLELGSNAGLRVKANPDHALVARFDLIIPGTGIVEDLGGTKTLEWPSESELPGWKVETSTDLIHWTEAESECEDDGIKKRLHLPGAEARRFYRMVHD